MSSRIERRRAPGARAAKRGSRTAGTVVATVGICSTAVVGVIGQVTTGDFLVLDVILYLALALMLVTFVIGAIWASVVLIRQLAIRAPRRRALKSWAAAHQWAWYPRGKDIPMGPETFRDLEAITPTVVENNQKRARFSEFLQGTAHGRPMLAVHFERGSGYLLEVEQLIATRLPAALPDLLIRDRAEDDLLTNPHQRFESEQFNHTWRVEAAGKDTRYASAFTHPQLMELLNGLPESVTEFRIQGDWLIAAAPTALTPAILEAHLDALTRVAVAVPDWVWREYATKR